MTRAREREEPTPPTPLPEGEGEEGDPTPTPSKDAQEATPSVTPFPSGRGAGGVGSPRRKRLALLGAVLAVGFAVWYFAIRTPEPKDDFGRFQGEWQLAVPALDRENKPIARPRPVTVRVTGDRWVYVADGQERGHYLMTLRPEANPKEIDLVQLGPGGTPTAFVIRGVYTIDRARAKIVHAPDPDPRPTDPDDPDATVWLLERVK